VAIWLRCFYHNKKAPNGAVLLWCPEVDELLNSVRAKTLEINAENYGLTGTNCKE